jgi:general secretion pathway protein F
MRFQVKAVRDAGAIEVFECDAMDVQEATRQAAGRGLTVLKVSRSGVLRASGGGARFPLLLFSQELAALLEAGVPLLEALETLAEKERAASARGVLAQLITTLREGRPLSAALEQLPAVFPLLYVATVRASERTGDLAPSILRFVDYQSRLEVVKKKVINASIYPALLIGVGGLVCLFLLLYVVPRFSQIYQERSADLPLFSRLLLAWGNFADAHGTLVIALAAALAAAVVATARSGALRSRLLGLLWAWPAAAERLRAYQLVRFYRTTGMLLTGGIPVVGAFEMAAGVLDARMRGALEAATRAVRQGKPIAAALEAHGLTTPVATRMLAVGERSGNMGAMLDKVALFHEEELSRWIEWFSRLFEPLLMTAIGLVIGVIVILMYMPIFELAGSIR